MGTEVNTEVLDPARGLRTGTAGLTRKYPMLSTLPAYQLGAKTCMLDDRWQYPQMNMGTNNDHRIPILYVLPKAPASLSNAYLQAYLSIINASFQPQLQPLDNDPDFRAFSGGAPDFHPRLQQFCSSDRDTAKQPVQNLIDQIQGKNMPPVASIAQVMGNAFRNLYRQMSRMPEYASQTAQLQTWIGELNQFLASLKNG